MEKYINKSRHSEMVWLPIFLVIHSQGQLCHWEMGTLLILRTGWAGVGLSALYGTSPSYEVEQMIFFIG